MLAAASNTKEEYEPPETETSSRYLINPDTFKQLFAAETSGEKKNTHPTASIHVSSCATSTAKVLHRNSQVADPLCASATVAEPTWLQSQEAVVRQYSIEILKLSGNP